MKKLIPLFLFISVALFAAYTRQNTRVYRFSFDPTYDVTGVATAVPVTVHLQNRILVNDADSTDVVGKASMVPVQFDLLAAPVATTNYTAAGKTVNGQQLAALLQALALSEANRQGVP